MASVETIREYLVALGFSVDEQSFRKFNSSILKATEPVLKLGAAVTAAATAIELMVERVSRQMEDLYYASQRTNAAAESLMAVGFAARQVGLEAGQGTDLLEGLGRAMRMNPGTEGLINSLGIQTRTAGGQLRDMSGVLDDVLKRLAQMPRFQALRFGQLLGFDPDALNQILNNLPQFIEAQERARKSLHDFGVDATDAANKGVQFSRSINTLERDIGNLATRIGVDFEPAAKKMVDWADNLIVRFGKFNDTMGGTPGKIAAITGALGGLLSVLALFAKGRAAIASAGSAIGGAAGWLLGRIAGPLGILLGSTSETNTGERDYIRAHPELYPFAQPGGSSPLGIRNNNPGNLQPGGVEAHFATPLAGLSAMAGNLLRYAQHGWDTVEQIVKHWAPAAAGNDVSGYIADLAKRTGFSAGQHLNLTDPATLERLMRGIIIHEQGQNPYSHELISAAISGRLSGTVVSLNQKTEINVNGASDAANTAKRVGDEQSRVNGDLARNLAAVVR